MSKDRMEPTRWKADSSPRTPDELWLRDAFRAVAAPETPDELGLERVWRAVAEGARRPPRRVARRWVLVVAGFVLGASSGALAALGYYAAHRRARGETSSAKPGDLSVEKRGERRWRVRTKGAAEIEVALSRSGDSLAVVAGQAEISLPAGPGPAADADEAAGAHRELASAASRAGPASPAGPRSKTPTARARLRAGQLPLSPPRLDVPRERIAQPVEATSETASGTASEKGAPAPPSEGRLLAEALSRLRGAGDARAALDRLDLYARLYPRGRLAQEAALIRAEALFRSRNDGLALAQLDRLPMSDIAGARPLTLLRGELRAARERCREAVADLDAVFRPDRPDELSERALYTRAACRERLGDTGKARSDVETYLRLFPLGPRGAEARAFLTTVGGPRPDPSGSP